MYHMHPLCIVLKDKKPICCVLYWWTLTLVMQICMFLVNHRYKDFQSDSVIYVGGGAVRNWKMGSAMPHTVSKTRDLTSVDWRREVSPTRAPFVAQEKALLIRLKSKPLVGFDPFPQTWIHGLPSTDPFLRGALVCRIWTFALFSVVGEWAV